MTDPSPWVSPGGKPDEGGATPFSAPPPPPPVPPVAAPVAAPVASPYGPPPGQGGWGPPPGQPTVAGQPAPGWTPPPKPGLIPLRPLTLGPLLAASFQVMRRNPRPTFGLSLLLSGAVSIIALLISGLILVAAFQRIENAAPGDVNEIMSGSIGIVFVSLLIPIGVSIGATAILQGIISLEVARGTVGEKLRLRGLMRLARGRIGALIGWAALLLAGVVIGILLIVVITVALGVAFGAGGLIAGGVVGFFIGAGLVVVAIWIGIKTALVPSVLMMERLPLRTAIARSWRLTDGYFWRTFGILALVLVIVNVATNIVAQPVAFIAGIIFGVANPLSDMQTTYVGLGVVYLATLVVTLIAGAIGLVVQSAAAALVYIDLRMRKEGLDVELVRFVEAKQAGDSTVPDPYLPRDGGFVPTAQDSPQGSPW